MYDVSITNDYIYALLLDGKFLVGPNGGTVQLKNWGSHVISVPGMGDLNFIDMGDKKLARYTTPDLPWTESTWGGLIRYRGVDAYFRYEGQGQVNVVLDQYADVQLTFPQGGMIVSLDDLTVK